MKKTRFSEGQIVGILKQAEAGVKVKDLCRKHGFSAALRGASEREELHRVQPHAGDRR